MPPEALGLLTAVAFACGHTFARAALSYSDPRTTALVNALSQAVILWIFALALTPLSGFLARGIWFFVLDGLMVPAMSRWLFFYGINKVGLSRATTLAGTSPVFIFLMAVLLVKESFTLVILVAIFTIVLGIYLVSQRKEEGHYQPRHLAFPVAAAFIWGVSPNVRKLGLATVRYPIIGATVTATVSLIEMAGIVKFSGGWKELKLNLKALPFQFLSGLAHASAVITYNYGLSTGQVVVVAPLANTTPLFTLPLAYIFFRSGEGITTKTILGTFALLLGAFLIFTR